MSESKISCPNCGHSFDVEAVLADQASSRVRQEMESKYADRFKELEAQKVRVSEEMENIEKNKQLLNEKFKERVKKELLIKEKELAVKTEKDLREQYDLQISQLKEENEKRKDENKQLKQKELELLRKEDALKEKAESMELEAEKYLLKKKQEIVEGAMEKKLAEFDMQKREYEKKLQDQNRLLQEAQRKAEQGSMQLQGEVQELAIEEWLEQNFPLDTIEEIKKGQRGGDCYQVVNSRTSTNCGIIYYESKRTKHFKQDWIAKLKTDMTAISADIGVIVSEVLPDDMDRMGMRDGVWICTYEEFKGLSFVLRETILKIHLEKNAQENKGDKMVMLYDFLTSNEFRLQIESIVDSFVQMQQDLETEKRSMQRIWKSREKQIQRVVLNTNHFYASVKGIAGNAIGTIAALELPAGDSEDESDAS
ncbi:MAG: DUF2130 domain-containing protein [Bacteroidetes bacterium]|nr:DUF2130 domain-containing protein [Bacteroidota bacterium]